MALTGVHIVCGAVTTVGGAPMLGNPIWSETMTAAGTTALPVPLGATSGTLCLEVRAGTADVYVARGKTPNASALNGANDTARIFIGAGESRNLFCSPGDKLAWVAA